LYDDNIAGSFNMEYIQKVTRSDTAIYSWIFRCEQNRASDLLCVRAVFDKSLVTLTCVMVHMTKLTHATGREQALDRPTLKHS